MATLYWAVYPAGQADPPASEIIAGTVPNGVFSQDVAPTVDDTVTGAQITGLTPGEDYKLACVWDDGVDTSNVEITTLWTTTSPAVDTDVDLQSSVDINITTPLVDVSVAIDTNVDLQSSVDINITTPSVEILEGVDVSVDLQNSVDINITTPATDVSFFAFTNVHLQNSIDIAITTPSVDVVEFVDTVITPTSVRVNITTPPVDVVEGLDVNVSLGNAVEINITTPATTVEQPQSYLVATEAVPLEYEITGGGIVELEAVDEVFAWMNEHNYGATPFPAVWTSDLNNRTAAAGGTVGWTVVVLNAGGYQWYIDYEPLIGETGPNLILDPITLSPGTYGVSCIAINPQGNGIRSNVATLTVT